MKNSVIGVIVRSRTKKADLEITDLRTLCNCSTERFHRVLTAVRQNFKREWSWRKVSKRLESIVVARNRNSKYGSERPSWSSLLERALCLLIRDASQSLSILISREAKAKKIILCWRFYPKTDFMECCTPYIMEFLNSYGSWILEAALGYTKISNVRSQCNKVKMYWTAFFSKESSHDWLMNESMLDNKHSFQPSLASLPSPLAPRQRRIPG